MLSHQDGFDFIPARRPNKAVLYVRGKTKCFSLLSQTGDYKKKGEFEPLFERLWFAFPFAFLC